MTPTPEPDPDISGRTESRIVSGTAQAPAHASAPAHVRKGSTYAQAGRAVLLGLLVVSILSLVTTFAIGQVNTGAAPANSDATKEQLQLQQKEQQVKLQQTSEALNSLTNALEEIDRSLQQKEDQLNDLKERQASVEQKIASLEKERAELELGLVERRVQLQKRLRALYKYSNKGFMQALLAGGTGSEILKRMKYLQIIIEQDMALISTQRRSLDRLSEVKSTVEQERIQVKDLSRQVEQQLVSAQEERARKQVLLTKLKGEKDFEARRLKELEGNLTALAKKVEEMNAAKAAAAAAAAAANEPKSPLRAKVDESTGFANQISRLPFPVPGGKVTRAFGRYKVPGMKASENSRGLIIKADIGTAVKAIYQGEVKVAEWFNGFGLLLIIDHGDGFHSIYAHASKLLKKPGEKVKTGEKVALVGDTGSFDGPQLYLEVRQNGKPENPIQWVRVPPDAMAIE